MAPEVMSDAANQRRSARTGQVASSVPKGMPTLRPAASWSVFERRRSMTRPSLVKERWAKSIAASSERRKAPAKPTRTSARSRRPESVLGHAATIRRMSLVRSGALPSWAVPIERRMPLRVSLTTKWWLDEGEASNPAAW